MTNSLKMPVLYLLFVKYFHGKMLTRLFVFNQHDSAERTSAQGLQTLKVVQRRSLLREGRGKSHISPAEGAPRK